MSAEKPINFFEVDQLAWDTPASRLQLEMHDAVLSVDIHDQTMRSTDQPPHQLVALMEHTFDPKARELSAKTLNTRIAVGMLSCVNPRLQIVNGRLFFNTHGYYEIPNIQANDFFGTQMQTGAMHLDWAKYYRLEQPIYVPKNHHDAQIHVHLLDQYQREIKQLRYLYGEEVPSIFKQIATELNPKAAPDLEILNHQLLGLANHPVISVFFVD